MYLTIKQQVKHLTKEEYNILRELCRTAKNLTNQAIYNADNPQTYEFSGKRVKRGLYQTKYKYCFNADCNGALNILRKSKAVDLTVLCNRGELDTPKRIRIA